MYDVPHRVCVRNKSAPQTVSTGRHLLACLAGVAAAVEACEFASCGVLLRAAPCLPVGLYPQNAQQQRYWGSCAVAVMLTCLPGMRSLSGASLHQTKKVGKRRVPQPRTATGGGDSQDDLGCAGS